MLTVFRRQVRDHIRHGDFAAASALLSGNQTDVDGSEVLVLKALLAIRQGETSIARNLLDEAVTLDAAHPEARITLARMDLSAGNPDGALQHLALFEIAPPLAATAQRLKARALLAKGELAAAGDVLAQVFHANPADLDSGRKAVALLAQSGADAAAASLASDVLAAHPADPDLFKTRVELLLRRDDDDAISAAGPGLAARDADTGIAIVNRLIARERLVEAASVFQAIRPESRGDAVGRDIATQLCTKLLTAAEALGSQEHQKLAPMLTAARALAPRHPGVARVCGRAFQAEFSRGVAALRAGHGETARAAFERALEFEPEHTGALDSLARAAIAVGDETAAVRALQRLADLKPGDLAIWRRLARIAEAAGDLRTALAAERGLMAQGLPDAAARFTRIAGKLALSARQSLDGGDLDQAFAIAIALRDAGPEHPIYGDLAGKLVVRLVRAAYAARRLRRHADAAGAADRALTLDPANIGALAILAATRLSLNEYGVAAEIYRRILQAEPENGAALSGLARAETRGGNAQPAEAAADRASSIPTGPEPSIALEEPATATAVGKPAKRKTTARRRSRSR